MNAFALSEPAAGTVSLEVGGDWSMSRSLPSLAPLQDRLRKTAAVNRMLLGSAELGRWDSSLLAFLFLAEGLCREHGISVDRALLPPGVRRLMELATAAPARSQTAKPRPGFLTRIGLTVLRELRGLLRSVTFLGESLIAVGQLVRGRARYRAADLWLTVQECGAEALPIVSIICLLIGMILAFVGAVQLRQFGADIYDANLVAVGMAREMGAVMTGIVLAGRTGAAFAAQIGAMQGNEEIDALSTLAISPIEFLVLPRMLALIAMTPLLCAYGAAVGIAGGFIVAINTLNVTPVAYLLQTQSAVTLGDFGIGIVKGSVFGALIAVTGCLRGIESGRSAASVGAAATSAVVSGILAIIVTDAIFAVLLNMLGL
ncbi:MAG TPA: ABC transporter permease [Stellaceae bacterium]|nr:ABC transporter permease [Stellaceae bacterium]